MKSIVQSSRFKKDFKRCLKRGLKPEKFQVVLQHLVADIPLPEKYRLHRLSGDFYPFWECHIEPDWLLIFGSTEKEIELVATGTHSDLFR